jgi:drug/metabolite transporter (DMT)-like permease
VPFAIFHFKKIPKNKLGVVILSAVFGNLLPAFLFAAAMSHKMDGALGGILNSLTPICVVVIGILFFKANIASQKIVGVLVGFGGLLVLTIIPALTGEKPITFENMGYSLLILLATLLYGINVNMVGQYLKGVVHPIHAATVSLACMTIPTGIVLWQQGFFELDFGKPEVQKALWASTALGVFCSAIATALFYVLVQKAGALFASLVTYGIPFIALIWGLIDHEAIYWGQIVGLCIILLGVYLANRPARDKS